MIADFFPFTKCSKRDLGCPRKEDTSMSQYDDLAVEEEGPQDERVLQPQKSAPRKKAEKNAGKKSFQAGARSNHLLGSASDLPRMRKVSKSLVAFLASSRTESVCSEPSRYGDHSRD